MTLWQIITGNSSLPVQPGNTFWDHLNNQAGGNCPGIVADAINDNAELLAEINPVTELVEVQITALSSEVEMTLTAEIKQTQHEAILQCSS